MRRSVAILYPGEMGSAVGRALVDADWTVVSCLEGRGARSRSAAKTAGMTAVPDLAAAVAGVDVVVSLVPPSAAVDVAAAVAGAVAAAGRTPVYLDANSISPATAKEVCSVVTGAGCECVDGAFVGSAQALGSRTTLYLSGGRAQELAALLEGTLRTAVLGGEIGTASGFKLAFAGFNKGLVALFLEVMGAAERLGRREALFSCLREFYPGTVETVERLLPSYPRHAARRVEEIAEFAEDLRAHGAEAVMAEGTRVMLARFAALGLDGTTDWDAEAVLDACRREGLFGDGSSRP